MSQPRLSLRWLPKCFHDNMRRASSPAPITLARGKLYDGPVSASAWMTLAELWAEPFTVSSNFARERAEEIALLASLGWISTIAWDCHTYSRLWRMTAKGYLALVNPTAQ